MGTPSIVQVSGFFYEKVVERIDALFADRQKPDASFRYDLFEEYTTQSTCESDRDHPDLKKNHKSRSGAIQAKHPAVTRRGVRETQWRELVRKR
jgi:hypothetical protein